MKGRFLSAGRLAAVVTLLALSPVPARCQIAPTLTAQPALDSDADCRRQPVGRHRAAEPD